MNDLSTGDLARACAVSPDTIRYYHKRGALGAVRSGGGSRRFDPAAIRRVRVIRNAIAIGFTLDELVRFFAEKREGRPPCRQVRAAAEKKLAALDQKIRELQELRKRMAGILRDWDARLATGEPAHLLESLHERISE
ncbi:MAG TPA: MerR family transcriptional regulator [Thermoanaerobaculia bacterium]|nr:MerR family transcriptional regulator [Thermoanaerobaculia bacterium]